MKLNRLSIGLLVLSAAGIGTLLLKFFNPLQHGFFPKCPVKQLTGFDCPGCGGQRAAHHLLNGEIEQAFLQNPLIFILTPYILLGFYLQLVPNPKSNELKLRKTLYGYRAIQVVFGIIILYTIVRNTL